jgi:hypothetical protein
MIDSNKSFGNIDSGVTPYDIKMKCKIKYYIYDEYETHYQFINSGLCPES